METKLVAVFLATMMAMAALVIADDSPAVVARWYQNWLNGGAKTKLTRLHFYMQDVVSGRNPTAVEIARSRRWTDASGTYFGLTRIFDDPLTVEGSPRSQTIGYGQGLYSGASKSAVSLLFTFNFYFTDGMYNGSTLTIQGRNHLGSRYREMAITGGTGVFRLAQGSAVASTYWANSTTQDGIVEFTIYVLHFDMADLKSGAAADQ